MRGVSQTSKNGSELRDANDDVDTLHVSLYQIVTNTEFIQQKAMAESILYIEEARHCLEIFRCELEQETRSHIALDSIIVGAEDSLARTSRKRNSATRQITDMHNFQDVVKASNKDVQAAMKGTIKKARHNLKRSIKTKEDADKEFQRQQEELDAYKDY